MPLTKIQSRGTDNIGAGSSNLIINGNCAVSQRGTQSNQSNDHYSAIDRFEIQVGSSGAVTSTQSSTAPTDQGFSNSLKVDVVTNNGGSEDASDYLLIMQKIEGLNLQQLKYGTSSAVPLACSFYVRSNLTGTFQFQIEVPDSGSYKYYGKTYTIDSANTWEKKTINIVANTNSSAIPDDNTEGLRVQWQLVGGSNYSSGTYTDGTWHGTGANRLSSSVNNTFARSTDNEFLLTGVQLEVGSQASDFQHESFDDTFKKCTRYLQVLQETDNANIATCHGTSGASSTRWYVPIILPYGELRVNPTLSVSSASHFRCTLQHSNSDTCSAVSIGYNNKQHPNLSVIAGSSVAGVIRMFGFTANADARLTFDAEL